MKKNTFEDNVKRVEEIIKHMESNQIPLNESFKYFEEGIKLIKSCETELESTQGKVLKLLDRDGEITKVPFEGEES
ncbi:exodeoxyribonuclease VII small subunit [Alkalibacter mobilis]|uniref:exodeoxyribonuclease VII small subunit n=1 Tax=Alkalibacter mobilis TaxID=2787712 RepID=UPI00189CD5C0|nr:exodeoxyribonuclease VII small subunit [Alkalibacter mobilis]MBF7097112.1 exodeoxyribonuclease VII small subunit [Alkalibacter mobilis]